MKRVKLSQMNLTGANSFVVEGVKYTDLTVVGTEFHFSNDKSNVVLDASESPHLIARDHGCLMGEYNVPLDTYGKAVKMLQSGFNVDSIATSTDLTVVEVQAISHEANYGGMGLSPQKVPAGLDKDALVLKVAGFIQDIDQVALKVATKDTLQSLVASLHSYKGTRTGTVPKGTKSVLTDYIVTKLGVNVVGLGKCTKPVLEAICRHLCGD